jgi:hypothetical protein
VGVAGLARAAEVYVTDAWPPPERSVCGVEESSETSVSES